MDRNDDEHDGGGMLGTTTLEEYRVSTMRSYGLMIEYKHLKQYAPTGIYVLPSFDNILQWHGIIFLRRGLYRQGVFKFQIDIPKDYNGPGTYPKVTFLSKIFNPFIHPETGVLDLKAKFSEWNHEFHYMVSVLEFLKSVFYLKQLPEDIKSDVHPAASALYQNDLQEFTKKATESVEESLRTVYDNNNSSSSNSSIKLTRPIPAHEKLRTTFLQQLDQDVRSSTIDNAKIQEMLKFE